MPSIQFCQDGLSVRVIQEGNEANLVLAIEREAQPAATFACHLDDLLAPVHGMAYQTRNRDGHILITPEGEAVRMSFSVEGDGSRSCNIDRHLYERSLMALKTTPRAT